MNRLAIRIFLSISSLLLFVGLVNGQHKTADKRAKNNRAALARTVCLPAQITASKTLLCANESSELRSNILPTYRYRWFKDGAVIVGETTYLLTINTPGTYRLEVTNTADLNCVQTSDVVIGQSSLRNLSILPIKGQVACEGSLLVAAIDAGTANPASSGLTYNWQRNGFTIPGNSPTLRANVPGIYTTFVLDANCAVSSGPVEVFPTPKPVFPAVPPICANATEQVTLSATPANGIFSGKETQNGQFKPKLAGSGQHTLTYSVTSAQGCPAQIDQTIRVIDVPQPDLGPNQTIIAGTRVVLQGPPGPALSYIWDPISGLLTDPAAPTGSNRLNLPRVVAQPDATTTYRLTVSEDSQCPLSSSMTITVLPGLFFSSAFTPNGDGTNDVWVIRGAEAFPLCSVRIYNRWGELIVDQSPYDQPWDGRVRGERVAPGPYRYVISPAPFLPDRAGTLMVLE